MKQKIKITLWAKLALLIVAIIWGSSLVVVKSTANHLSPCFLLAMRFTISCVILCIVFHRKLSLLNRNYFKCGAIIGSCLFAAYCSQTLGVMFTMPGKSAFLSSVYCVIVPFLFWAVDKNKPDLYNVLAAVICTVGVGLTSMTSCFSISKGDSLALLSGFFFASHIVSVAKFGKGKDPFLITILQFGFSAAFSWIASAVMVQGPIQWTTQDVAGVLYLSVMCTTVSLLLQNIGQKYIDPSSAAIVLSLESVFGIVFSVIVFHEALNLRLVIGFVLIFTAVFVSETKLSFIKGIMAISKKVNKF